MNAIKKALFEKAWEKEQNYNDAVARWGEDNLASKLYWTAFNPLFEVIQNAGLEVEYHRWVREQREGRVKARALNERGQKREYSRFSYGDMAHAREEAEKYRDNLIVNGFTNVRVEIWQVIATDYKGTIRG